MSLYLPALIIGFAHPGRWLEFARRPLMPMLLALFGWATVSLVWSNARRPADEFLRLLTVLLFLFAVVQGLGNDPRRQRGLLLCGAGVLTATAVAAMVKFALYSPAGDRLIGFGVMANANLIGAAMGAGILWLWPWRFQRTGHRLLKWLAMALMATSLLLTYSRSAWIALFTAVFVLLAVRRSERAWQRLVLLFAVALGVAIAAYPELTERGLSFRPQIFEYALGLIAQHPWLGWGLGASFTIPVEAGTGMFQVHTHNLFTQVAVELGLPGLLLWLAVWLGLGWRAWHFRQEPLGRVILGLWLFASVMVQFDLPHLIDSPRPGWLILWLPLALSLSLSPVAIKRRPVQ
ncbi:O-antigen ligase family protein [Stenotrophomonas humi]|uniref:O-antigen ligase family protein n=1 Tax=Stenotrophomonas humi TaxID=405444 RepID=UPI00137A1429|nr:O-antigen ligase family protein [Stenotrophomonas humi]